MSLLAVPIIAVSGLLVSLLVTILFIYLFKQLKKNIELLNAQQQADEFMLNNLQNEFTLLKVRIEQTTSKSENDLVETIQVSKQLEHRIKLVQTQLQTHQQQVMQLQESDGQDKFYTRAFKLAEKGADIEEIMAECELPRAEVEMLLSVYAQRKQPK
ncbi:DUF2802 domain-containing protein [Colwellia sp. RSH04]|uniref:DUF2802 domain-containing protein n=1 Tax=Colwellia sp. RSH04 TaxID=2305464 RepID=UPI000E5887AB|nr:DUF2802 domain-containing protein [Colwellia sp. RSH04]RHW76007.1 DUF2802 domain-containing protein [Colwellia sp. RSH04]